MKKIVLASSSPRRRRLLEQLDMDFIVQPSRIDESKIEEENSICLVQKLSYLKADEVAREESGIIIAADTVVTLEGEVLEKPNNKAEAYKMLQQLSGTSHQVVTGITIIMSDKSLTDYQETEVTFRQLTDKEIDDYIATEEPMDKAGAYGIQGKGAIFVEQIKGDFYNVVGLPIVKLIEMLREVGEEFSLNG
ncbi:Maf family protein [Halanaerocella petrolearia]